MATSLAEIRAKLQAQDTHTTSNTLTGDNGIYAHWNIAEGTTARVRFLPDANTKNTFFWVERLMIKLPFAGIKGQSDSKPVIVQVPCVEMYGDACPILAEVRPWFKDKTDTTMNDLGRKYWKKKSYLFQGLVRDNPMSDEKIPENPIRRFVISPQIFNLVKNALMDTELENLPTDYQGGLDFNIKKTSKGGYSDYSTSTWARKESALTSEEIKAIDTYGLYNLADFLPKRPGETEIGIIKEMFEASVNGEAYDGDRWAQYFKPVGLNNNNSQSASSAPKPAPKSSVVEDVIASVVADIEADDAPFETVKAPVQAKPSNARAEDILAMIRNRQKQ